METLIPYIVKVNLSLAIFYLLYALLFRKDTFIRLRRYYFLSAIIFSLSYPLFTVSALGNLIDFSAPPQQQETSVYFGDLSMESIVVVDEAPQKTFPLSLIDAVSLIMATGILFFIFRFLWQLLSIIRIKSRSEKRQLYGYTIYHLQDEITPFSFFNWIFIHLETHTEEELKQILLHEHTHVSQRHSIDVMLAEMMCIAFWYNPIVWFMKGDVAINLEYLADNAVLQKGIDTHEYQCNLLQMNYPETAVQLINNFNVSQLKQRIIMMNSQKSPLRKLAKYLSVLPITMLLIMANSVYAQQNELQQETTPQQEPVKKDRKISIEIKEGEEYPEMVASLKKMTAFIESEMKYPQIAKENGIQGNVLASFILEKDGSVSNPKIEKGVDPSLDKEAIRVINAMPNWAPFTQEGEPKTIKYTLPFNFSLTGKEVSSDYSVIGFKAVEDEKYEAVVHGSTLVKSSSPQTLAEKFGTEKPLFIVDNVIMDNDFDLKSINPEDIDAINVVKNETSIKNYGDKGKNGVVIIFTKQGSLAKKIPEIIERPHKEINGDEVFVVVEDQPQFPGGNQALMSYLGDNIKYPVEAHKNGIEGRVIANFIVNKDGSISDVKIVRGVDPLLDAEAVRVLSLMPKWKAGMQRGQKVKVRYTIPVVFSLNKSADENNEAVNKLKDRDPVTVYEEKDDKPDEGFLKFIAQTIKYPVIAQENGIMGVSRATFDVNGNGEISNVKITESVDPSLDAELVRVTKLIPKDIALIKTMRKAASNVAISVLFRLQDEKGTYTTSENDNIDVVVVGYGKPVEKK